MTIAQRVLQIQALVQRTCQHYQRELDSVRLIAVSKNQPVSAIKEAYAAGIVDFGENYWQEAQIKIETLEAYPLTWHFIGAVQSNKVRAIAQKVSWVHSIDREKTANLLSAERPIHLPPMNVCIQVNLDNEPGKAGIPGEALFELASHVNLLPHLRLRGLMAIPAPSLSEEQQYESLLRLTKLMHEANQQLALTMDTLSMGMSDDLQPAIHAGSTLIRVGRAIFGERSS